MDSQTTEVTLLPAARPNSGRRDRRSLALVAEDWAGRQTYAVQPLTIVPSRKQSSYGLLIGLIGARGRLDRARIGVREVVRRLDAIGLPDELDCKNCIVRPENFRFVVIHLRVPLLHQISVQAKSACGSACPDLVCPMKHGQELFWLLGSVPQDRFSGERS
jgi:hypothetical protein